MKGSLMHAKFSPVQTLLYSSYPQTIASISQDFFSSDMISTCNTLEALQAKVKSSYMW